MQVHFQNSQVIFVSRLSSHGQGHWSKQNRKPLQSEAGKSWQSLSYVQRVPDVSYPNLFVTRRFVPGVSLRVRVRYFR